MHRLSGHFHQKTCIFTQENLWKLTGCNCAPFLVSPIYVEFRLFAIAQTLRSLLENELFLFEFFLETNPALRFEKKGRRAAFVPIRRMDETAPGFINISVVLCRRT